MYNHSVKKQANIFFFLISKNYRYLVKQKTQVRQQVVKKEIIWKYIWGGSDGEESAYNLGDPGFNPWVRKIPWRREWLSTPVFLPEEFHGQRSLVGYSPWGHKESDTTEWLTHEKEGGPRFLSYINGDHLPSPCRRRVVCWETRNKGDCRSEDTRHKNGHQNQELHNLKVYVLNRKTSPKSSFLTSSRILVVQYLLLKQHFWEYFPDKVESSQNKGLQRLTCENFQSKSWIIIWLY